MLKLILRFLLLVLLAAAVAWLADHPGTLTLEWLGYRIEELPVALALLALVLLVAVLMLLWALLSWVFGSPGALGDYFRRRRRRRGLEAVSKGLVAVNAGDAASASSYSHRANRYVSDEPLAKLLAAQAAQLTGDTERVTQHFREMADDPETELVGLRGLYLQARQAGDPVAARRLAERAYEKNPNARWASQAMVTHLSAERDWPAVDRLIEQQRRSGVMAREDANTERAVALTAHALDLEERDESAATDLAVKAHKLDPSLVPAAVLAARLLAHQGSLRRASKIVERTWRLSPHPDLAEIYVHARAGDSAQDRLKRIRELLTISSGGEEGAIALAAVSIDARDWAGARQALRPLLQERPSARVCQLMAEIEQGEFGDRGRAREWLARAVRAPRPPAWTADGVVSPVWLPVSPVTGELGAFRWKVPLEGIGFAAGEEELDAGLDDDIARGRLAAPAAAPAPAAAAAAEEPAPVSGEPVAEPVAERPVPQPHAAPEPVSEPVAETVEAQPAATAAPDRDVTPAEPPQPKKEAKAETAEAAARRESEAEPADAGTAGERDDETERDSSPRPHAALAGNGDEAAKGERGPPRQPDDPGPDPEDGNGSARRWFG